MTVLGSNILSWKKEILNSYISQLKNLLPDSHADPIQNEWSRIKQYQLYQVDQVKKQIPWED